MRCAKTKPNSACENAAIIRKPTAFETEWAREKLVRKMSAANLYPLKAITSDSKKPKKSATIIQNPNLQASLTK